MDNRLDIVSDDIEGFGWLGAKSRNVNQLYDNERTQMKLTFTG
jgi:hypothetical protein